MAKKPRMGRNLDALLNTGARDRKRADEENPAVAPATGARETAGETARETARETAGKTPVASLPGTAPAADGVVTPGADASTPASPDAPGVASLAVAAPASSAVSSAVSPAASRDVGSAGSTVGSEAAQPGDRLRMIGIEHIRRGVYQPRRNFDQDALQELADSLQAQGVIQPIIVRPFGGAYELIAGERRWRAAQLAGLREVPAIVREMEDRKVAAVSLIENIQREDLNPLEEAQALSRLCDEFGMTHSVVAESIGRSRASVSNLMRLLELHDEVKVRVDKGELDMGHARALLSAPLAEQPALAARVVSQGMTVRAVEKLIRNGGLGGESPAPADRGDEKDPDVRRLEERLSGVLGAQVLVRQKAGGAGKLEISYTSLDELDGIIARLE